jgi:hypothetical protein
MPDRADRIAAQEAAVDAFRAALVEAMVAG